MQERLTRNDPARERGWGWVQAVSGLIFLIFASAHLMNQMLAAAGPEVYNGLQRWLRVFYQHPLLELSLVGLPLLVHVVAGLRRMALRGVRGRGGGWRMRLHRVTGYFLLAVIFGHIAAVRGPSLFLGFFPQFEGVSFSLWWLPTYFYVYYTLLGLSGIYHGINGALLALRILGVRSGPALTRGWSFWLPTGVAMALLVVGLLGFGGILFDIADPTQNEYARMWHEHFGVSLGSP